MEVVIISKDHDLQVVVGTVPQDPAAVHVSGRLAERRGDCLAKAGIGEDSDGLLMGRQLLGCSWAASRS